MGRNGYSAAVERAISRSGSFASPIEALAHEIVAAATGSVAAAADAEILAFARTAAHAELDLARIPLPKPPSSVRFQQPVGQSMRSRRVPKWSLLQVLQAAHRCSHSPAPATPDLPSSEPTRADLSRSLTELLIVDRYEHRATAHRDRPILLIIARHVLSVARSVP